MYFITRRLDTAQKALYDTFPTTWTVSLLSAVTSGKLSNHLAKKINNVLLSRHMEYVNQAAHIATNIELPLTDDQKEAIFYMHLAEFYKQHHPFNDLTTLK